MTQTLKRCPFCGATAHINRFYMEDKFFAACVFCGNRTQAFDTPQKARKAWNRRYTVN